MTAFITKPLDTSTWADFAKLVEKHNGVWGGCWCMGFHGWELVNGERTAAGNRAAKQRRVSEGRAHAALVYDGTAAVGWCQFGLTDELPNIKLKKAYAEKLEQLPEWRITCFFIDKDYRGQGVAKAALEGALREIAILGGGTVESYPQEVKAGEKVSGSFLYNGTTSMFEGLGFRKQHKLGKNHWVVTKKVRPAAKK
jgi:GNAT superfamily N-acetyltransferase